MTDPSETACCEEFRAVSRRGLLSCAIALAGASTAIGSAVVTAAPAAAATASSVLVVLSLRGAADGLSLVVPHGDPVYYQARPRLAIPQAQLLVADEMFGLHPGLAPLVPLWTSGRLAAVQATGLPAPNRSHFAAMEEVEDADPGSTKRVGWLNRLIGTRPGSSPLQGFSIGTGVVPASLFGGEPVMSSDSVKDMAIPGDDEWVVRDGRKRSLHTMWDADRSPLGTAMRSTFSALGAFQPVVRAADNSASYPRSDLGRALASVARIIRGDVGVEVLTVDQGDWDMHSDLGTLEWGRMVDNTDDLARSVAAFLADLGSQAAKVTLVVLSEFGRRTVENDNYGLDHGYGNVMFVAGAGVKGGKVYGTWPGLTRDDDADLRVTTDYRSVLSEVVSTRFGSSTATVFPGFTPTALGLMTST
ncbi:DUF1501 domain-containing protein [Nocardioides sp. cx-173]|uniref:DUF1501 domain-containing protein n=1 Tax=Nocardioides sp. cx-173 TaxID=2898796 RepID=UPI001E65469C|nr:DUF1501 domain-containing protein [Nocardioides sp. cx-173]MCD4526818.1 DUF1501 domain-containing protein [Nocardioides sp. cx-173]UGB43920.1 DUF1501 domain-containing protein [Nocardioides sp. cx-173]